MIRFTFSLAALALASLLVAFDSRRQQEGPAPDFAKDMGVVVSDLTQLGEPSEDLARRVAKRLGEKKSFLQGVRLYMGRITDRNSGDTVEGRFAEVKLKDHGDIRLLMGLDPEGASIGVALWGTPEIDADPSFRWAGFLGQLRNLTSGSGLSLATEEKSASPSAWKRALKKAKGKERSTATALVEHRLLMRGNTQMMGQLFMLQRAGSLPGVEWVKGQRARYTRLSALDAELDGTLAPADIEAHTRFAEETVAVFDEMEATLAEGKEAFFAADYVGRFRSSCGACHQHELGDGQGNLQDVLSDRLAAFELPDGLLQLDYDVAPMVGGTKAEAELQQDVATAFRGVLLLFDGLE